MVVNWLGPHFHYLLLFQLLGLFRHYDYQYLTQLYPLGKDEKSLGFQKVLRIVLYGLLGIEVSLALLFSKESIMVMLLLLVGIFCTRDIYQPN